MMENEELKNEVIETGEQTAAPAPAEQTSAPAAEEKSEAPAAGEKKPADDISGLPTDISLGNFVLTKKKIIGILAGLAAVIAGIIILCTVFGGGPKAADLSKHKAGRSYNRREYVAAVAEYNAAVQEYNLVADRFDVLAGRLEACDGIRAPEAKKEQSPMEGKASGKNVRKTADIIKKTDALKKDAEDMTAEYEKFITDAYDTAVEDRNIVAKLYNEAVLESAVTYIEGLPYEYDMIEMTGAEALPMSHPDVCGDMLVALDNETASIIAGYMAVQRIKNPDPDLVMNRLKKVDGIGSCREVSSSDDPNGLLSKHGGYTACIYFTYDAIPEGTVEGTGAIGKGTDAGGCVEIYESLTYALARCDYLAQFDNSMLYSGSYTVAGTMVIRTSALLDGTQQCKLTGDILEALTRAE